MLKADRVIRSVKIVQGAAKERARSWCRATRLHLREPVRAIPLWIRDGWSASEKEMVDAARAASTDSPTVFVFVLRNGRGMSGS